MKLETVDLRSPNAPKQFVTSLKETGFGVLSNHPIPKDLVESIYDNWYQFFMTDEKTYYQFNIDTQDGYFPPSVSEVAKGHTIKDIKEYFHVYPWGQIPPSLKDEILDYYRQVNAFAQVLLGWVEENVPIDVKEKFSINLSEMVEGSKQSLLRVLHYPPMTGFEEPGAIRAAAHEDINLLTVLPAANEPGLQVLSKEGDWLDVPCDFGNLIINVGDMLQETSDGYFPSTTHRVINPLGEHQKHSRISLPLFLHPKPEVILSKRYTAESYLTERLRELGVL